MRWIPLSQLLWVHYRTGSLEIQLPSESSHRIVHYRTGSLEKTG